MPGDTARTVRPVKIKRYPVSVKAAGDGAAPGTFEAIVSVFGNVDYAGDRVMPGAFTRTLKERGLPPLYWNHLWGDGPIGETLEAEEREKGLWIKGLLWVGDDVGDPMVRRLHRSMLAGQTREFSFAYDVMESREVVEDGENVSELLDLDLFEAGPVTLGMNPATELLEVASRGGLITAKDARRLLEAGRRKSGRVLSSKNEEAIRKAVELLSAVLAQLEAQDDDDDEKGRGRSGDAADTIEPKFRDLLMRTRWNEEGQ